MPVATIDASIYRHPTAPFQVRTPDGWTGAHNIETARMIAGDTGTIYAERESGKWYPVRSFTPWKH